MNIQTIDINNLTISQLNVRTLSVGETLDNLRENIKTHGLLNPLTVKFNNTTNMYEIIAGQRRFNALKELKYKNIQCNVISNITLEKEQIVLSLTENIHRDNMKLSDIVKTYNKLYDKYYDSTKKEPEIIKEIAEITNTDIKIIKQYKEISHFPDSILDYLDKTGNEKMTIEFAIKLSKIGIIDEDELKQIIGLFRTVKHSDRPKLLKKIQDAEKYDSEKNEFHKYIEKIGKIRTTFLAEIKKKEEEEKKIRDEIIRQLEEEAKRKAAEKAKLEALEEVKQEPGVVFEPEKKEPESADLTVYTNKIQNIIEKNNNSVFIITNTPVRNPELQNIYREAIVKRFNKCIVSGWDNEVCEAAHIVPFSESKSFDIDNGLLLNSVLHKLFDKHYWSICSDTYCIKIFTPDNKNDIYDILKPYENKCLDVLKQYSNISKFLLKHYNIANIKLKE
jgi:ParB/RepB/Spo0J family partition protein